MRRCRHRPHPVRFRQVDLDGMTFTVPDLRGWLIRQPCEYGNCVELVCPVCRAMRSGWGPIDCPCDDHVPHPGMRTRRPVAVKPSAAGRLPSRRRTRNRR